MKKLIFFTFMVILTGCGNNKITDLIESYVCTTDGVVSDFKFKSLEFAESTPITSTDSMIYAFFTAEYYEEAKMSSLDYTAVGDSYKVIIKRVDGKQFENNFKIESIEVRKQATQEYAKKMSEILQQAVSHGYTQGIQDDKQNIYEALEQIKLYEKSKEYSLMKSGAIISRSFDCTYSIFNPVLQVKQTMTRKFYFDPNLTRVVGSSDIKK